MQTLQRGSFARASKVGLLLLASVSVIGLWSCASAPTTDGSHEHAADSIQPANGDGLAGATKTALDRRAAELWEARREEDWATVYRYEQIENRSEQTKERYLEWAENEAPMTWHSYQLGETIVDPPFGWVEVDAAISMRNFPGIPPRETSRWEKWVFDGEAWMPVPPHRAEDFPASPALRDLDAEARLQTRVEQSWDARLAGDWQRLYDLSDPRDHADVPFEEFEEAVSVAEYRDPELLWLQVIDEQGRVRVRFDAKNLDPNLTKLPPQTITATEDWIKVNGEWYRDLIRQ
jgi:hypothetical protein